MDILFAEIQADIRSNDALRQSGALLQALQQSAAGRDISVIAKSAVEEIVAAPASAVCKKLAFDLIRSTRLTPDLWETVCTGVRSDFHFLTPMSPLLPSPFSLPSLLIVWESSSRTVTKRSLTVSTRPATILGFRSQRP
ncbi:hypothetical protein K1719_024587 [Acacia pycnantha]|nr:hypothetical protein K1719_024587 [Acacia pycnantha]